MSIHLVDFHTKNRYEIKSENREGETLEHLRNVLIAQKILNPEEKLKLFYNGQRIKSDKGLQRCLKWGAALIDYDCFKIIRRTLQHPRTLYFEDLQSREIYDIKSKRKTEYETIKHLRKLLVAQGILYFYEELKLCYNGEWITSDESLQQCMNRDAGLIGF